MAAVHVRSPLGALDGTRLHKLTSVKNTQNAITNTLSASSLKSSYTSPNKRSIAAISFDDVEDLENVDPIAAHSASKRSKNTDGASGKVFTKVFLQDKPRTVVSSPRPLSVSVPNTTTSTPISASRGSPKNKRVGLLSKGRRASSSPFRRIDPPSTTRGLPFSIDEALKGTIPSYTPKPTAQDLNAEAPMPKGWFFDIHVDTAEQEASNLMEHSASVLDISSDDDATTRQQNELREKGKENIPPPGYISSNVAAIAEADSDVASASLPATAVSSPHNARRSRRAPNPNAMLEDRKALGELPAEDFYAEGLDALSNIVVRGDDVTSPRKPSGLSHEFDFSIPAVPSPRAKLQAVKKNSGKRLDDVDVQTKEVFVLEDEES